MDIKKLQKLRSRFLESAKPAYEWQSVEELELYDSFFARRISWKWATALAEIAQRGWRPPQNTILMDWACGTAAASETYLDIFENFSPIQVNIYDKSKMAMDFSSKKLEKFKIDIQQKEIFDENTIALVSHVLNELSEKQIKDLLENLLKCHTVIWVEPGAKEVSQKLRGLRNFFASKFKIVAPCKEGSPCLNCEDWCHHAVEVPNEIFHSREWSQFSKGLNIDIRFLTMSYVCFTKN